MKIDIPWINTVVRDRVNRGADRDAFDFLVEGLTPDAEPGGLDVQKRLFGNVETLAKLGSATAPVSNWLADLAPVRAALERVAGVDRRRELPAFHHETLRDWFGERGSRVDPAAADLSVVLYPDVYTNYVRPERGRGAVRVLESLGCHVRVPAVPESGRAPLSQGMVETARRQARDVHAALVEHVDAGRDVVVVEPSDLAMFRREYEKLLPGPSADRLGGASYEVLEYVHGLLSNGGDAGALASAGAVDYHPHCQQRTLGLTGHTVAVLEAAGADVRTSEAECCGMAGSFGYKRQYYELSADVGASLAAEFDADDRTVVASGTSCLDQLADLLDRDPVHPVALLDPARRE